ncbi:glycoside hydrolase family 52 protein [Fimbriimonas ginsengisoli]|uniref:Xylosidase b n=1 Tax=Fimbriimonas ginsengisoli Gsoil 348 TaxID=661478 RepID=A0A068NT28_FIMGI|nr:glycoside hydrolase family 52 protein [Fimbriimonas ginsengisoli]AIE85930.1 xylosidase b [Fimbriimonas ginsengisoli Gsoil 348]
MSSPFYNSHHSPIGAFATLTIGQKGQTGGLGLELPGPANEGIYVGVEDSEGGRYRALPFFQSSEGRAEDFDVEGLAEFSRSPAIDQFRGEEIERTMGAGIDEWRARDLTFRLISPLRPVPDPDVCEVDALRDAVTPAILAEITVDNRRGGKARRAFFGYQGSDRTVGMRLIDEEGLVGVAQHTTTAIATDDPGVYAGIAFQAEKILQPDCAENLAFLVGNLGLLVGTVQPGEIRTFRFAIGFFREGTATTGLKTRYLYRRFFDSIEEVLRHALARFDTVCRESEGFDARLRRRLSPDRAWMAAQAIRSYFGSTQLLEREDGRPLWVVNEGEYRMMNTFDLTVDQAFFELALNPWTVRNVLDLFVERYSYIDEVRFPGSDESHPGGLAFTHDMGVANAFSRPGYSGYEQSRLNGCFSYMSAEELMNWVLTAGLYDAYTHDFAWAVSQRATFLAALTSLINRDDPDPAARNGVIGLDGARCEGGKEITTYDSLDASLGQARNSLYLAVKGWATYVLLENVLRRLDEPEAADDARVQADRAVRTIAAAADADGLLPAVIGEGIEARTIPAIEALVYPFVLGLPIDPELKKTLGRHLEAVLRPGICKFADGGWKLSSMSRNSWLSKIYLCQFVAERVFGHAPDTEADGAHAGWLRSEENAYYAWSDQMLAGRAVGSRYYPRGVTSVLWIAEGDRPLDQVRELLVGVGAVV